MRTNILSFVLASENRKDIVKTLFEYPKRQWSCVAMEFISKIKSKVESAVLYGSSAKGSLKPESDIDILVVADKAHRKDILDAAADISMKSNRTVSPIVIDRKELSKEKKSQFMRSIKENMEVLYGKSPF